VNAAVSSRGCLGCLGWIVAGVIAFALFGALSDPDPDSPPGPSGEPSSRSAEPSGEGTTSSPGNDPSPSGEARQRTYRVRSVTDGDTLRLANGEAVRLVGIDAPERGACGSERATSLLSDLTLGQLVTLTAPVDDRDVYGRWLRYVDVGTVDAGLRMIKSGLAIARYDSRDGYDAHPRQQRYVRADRDSQNVTCSASPKPVPLSGGSCEPGYRPCVRPYPPDLDCDDVNGPIHVTGSDPHGLDADGDGIACES
jgi:endonuclease YncB( thermonuclease family)